MPLKALHDGIEVPEHETRIPWLVLQSGLFDHVPHDAFTFSETGWPMLAFTLLGTHAVFGSNFVTHPDGRLIEVRFDNLQRDSIECTFRRMAAELRRQLGNPNSVDAPDYHQVRWEDDRVIVDNHISDGYDLQRRQVTSHTLSVFYSYGMRTHTATA